MLTFEFIRDLERKEKAIEGELQKLPDNLMDEIRDYISKKSTSNSMMEIETAKKSLRELFKIREKKILDGAIYTANTGLNIENMEENEEQLHKSILNLINENRNKFIEDYKKPIEIKKETVFEVQEDLPEFIGPDLKKYMLKKGDIIRNAQLPNALNHFLVKKNIIKQRDIDVNTKNSE